VITNDVRDYINLSVRIAHIICNHPLYGPNKDEAGETFRILHNEEHSDVYRSRGIVRVMKPEAEHVAKGREEERGYH